MGILCRDTELFVDVCGGLSDLWPVGTPFSKHDQYHRDLGGDAVDGRFRRIGTQLKGSRRP
eukprot:6141259-Pyramimonas_sp.AAC.1